MSKFYDIVIGISFILMLLCGFAAVTFAIITLVMGV